MFISGAAETGKSFLIEAIRSQVKEIWKILLMMTLFMLLQPPQDLLHTI